MHKLGRHSLLIITIACALIGACSSPTVSVGPKFSGRLLFLSGENKNGADLIELTAPTASTYNLSIVTQGVFEASPSPDHTRLLYTTKDEIFLRDLHTGAVKSLVKGVNVCLAWSPDGNRFSYKQKSSASDKAPGGAAGSRTRLYVSDLDGKVKLIWDDVPDDYGTASPAGQSPVFERAAGSSGCSHWIAPDRLIFDRFLGSFPNQQNGATALTPNTTTVAILGDAVKLVDSERKWSIEGVCQAGGGTVLRPHDEAQPLLMAKSLEPLKTLNPSPISCSGCRFVGFAAGSCVPFFIADATSTTTDLVSLNPTNLQRQRGARINQTFSPNAKMLIKSSARLMIAGDGPSSLLLIDTETGETVSFFANSNQLPGGSAEMLFPRPVVWIEN